jgi:hypothetical protein
MKQEFIRCHDALANKTYRLVELLGQAESRGYLLEDSLTLVDTVHWLQMVDWQTKFLSMVLNFTKDPSSKSLRPLIELYGRDGERMKVEAEILERQLKHRLTRSGCAVVGEGAGVEGVHAGRPSTVAASTASTSRPPHSPPGGRSSSKGASSQATPCSSKAAAACRCSRCSLQNSQGLLYLPRRRLTPSSSGCGRSTRRIFGRLSIPSIRLKGSPTLSDIRKAAVTSARSAWSSENPYDGIAGASPLIIDASIRRRRRASAPRQD